jgi:D-threo-aldose 1-dehydrogenase
MVPPILCGTAALGNVPRVITEQSKRAIAGEWFRGLKSPIFIDAAYDHGDGAALEVFGRILRRLDIGGDEVVIQLTVSDRVSETWEKSCRLLGDTYRPKLLAVGSTRDYDWQAALELKAAGRVVGVGAVLSSSAMQLQQLSPTDVDWIMLACGPTVMRHSVEWLQRVSELQQRAIPVVVGGVFEGGFLVGGSRLDGRALRTEEDADRSTLAWRKSFVALCDGHGITPAHACIQFALALPGVVAVRVESAYADRVADNIRSALMPVPENFWVSMQEEGLLT